MSVCFHSHIHASFVTSSFKTLRWQHWKCHLKASEQDFTNQQVTVQYPSFILSMGGKKRSCEKKTFTGFFFTSKAKNRKEVIYHDYHVHSEFKTVFYKTTALKLEPIRQFTATSGYGWKAIVWNACLRQLRLWFLHRRVMWTQTNTYYAEHQCRALRDVRLREAYPGTHNYTLIQLKPLWDLENMLWLVPADLEDLLNAQFSIFM